MAGDGGVRIARQSFGPPYLCARPWPAECFVQAGGHGVVFTAGTMNKLADDPMGAIEDGAAIESGDKSLGYMTAFFEAFHEDDNLGGFVRGEGSTVFEAEDATWRQMESYAKCGHPEGFERRGYSNGGGFCKSCRMWKSRAFDPIEDSTA